MAHLSLALLGPLQVKLDGAPVSALESDKVRALLAYLALEAGRPHRRDALAGLLWPERPDRAAHLSLNQALANLRRVIGDRTAVTPVLHITPDTIQFDRTSDHDLDVAAFSDLLAACEAHPHRHPQTCTSCARRRQQAVELYRGSFLDQFFLSDSAPFEEWALLQREGLHRRALRALVQLADYHERCGEYAAAQQYAWRQLGLDPWREESHRQLMRLLALSGQRSAALVQYATCRRVLDEELGVEPEEETIALYARIQRGAGVAAPDAARPADNLAAHTAPTPFIGREAERAQLADRLEQRDCRLLTLVGPGGVGKTRLALQAASDLRASFPDGVAFVALAPLSAAELLVPAIASALGLIFQGPADPKAQLLAYLRTKDMLLVLDNVEHLLAGADLLSDLLQVAPAVVLLVTSREPLHLRVEWLLDIEGLPVPEHADASGVERSSAVQLFVQTARRMQADFGLSSATTPSVVRICHLVAGMPLAIELAASWVRSRSCAEIAQRLEQGLEQLATTMRDVPARHRSMRAVFDHSWRLLSVAEQGVLRQLSVFRGGMEADAAAQVAGATPSLLAALIDKSLLRRNSAGHYDLHELMRQYAGEQLEEAGEAEETRNQHAAYFLALTWSQIVGDATLGLRLAGALWRFWSIRGYLSEGRDWLTRFLALAQNSTAPPSVRGQALYGAGVLARQQSDYARTAALCGESLVLFRDLDNKPGMAWSLNELGWAVQAQGDVGQAAVLYQQSLALFRGLGDQRGIAETLDHLGRVAGAQSDYRQATTLFQESLLLFRTLEDKRGTALSLKSLGSALWLQGNYAAAHSLHEESLVLFRELGDNWGAALSLAHLGLVAREQGDYGAARTFFEESLLLLRELGNRAGIAVVLRDLGTMARQQGELEQARRLLEESLLLLRELGNRAGIGLVLANLGLVALGQGELERAASLFKAGLVQSRDQGNKVGSAYCLKGLACVLSQHPAGLQRSAQIFGAVTTLLAACGPAILFINRPTDRYIAAVRAQLGEATFAAAWAAGQAMPLEQAIACALGEHAKLTRV
jgi:predicted ATPase/DNA-binding SARP family transcriptional activator